MSERAIAVLFARHDSIYHSMPDVDVWDADRNALLWPGGSPIVAHPPCQLWGGLSHMSSRWDGERLWAPWCIDLIRRWGGVLEHPKRSKLWEELSLPTGQQVDQWGGFSLLVNQSWWGHRAEKATMLYICGIDRRSVQPAFSLAAPSALIGSSGRRMDGSRKEHPMPEVTKAEREHTPLAFADWLVDIARHCHV